MSYVVPKTDPINEYISALYIFRFKNRQHEIDTSNGVEGIADILQAQKVIKDDKLIKSFAAQKEFNCKEENTEVYLFTHINLSEELCSRFQQ